MTSFALRSCLAAALLAALIPSARLRAADPVSPDAPAAPAASPAITGNNDADHRSQLVLAALEIQDPVLSKQVLDLLTARAAGLRAWHAQHDAELKKLWAAFNKAHGKRDDAATDAANAAISALYAEIRPAHDEFLKQLHALLGPAEVELVEDKIMEDRHPQATSKFEATYGNYQKIFPALTDAQKAFIADKLKAARDEALDCQTQEEKSAFFKKYKIQIEAYLTAHGYDVKKSYYDFGQKLKAEMAAKAKKGGGASAAPADDSAGTKPQ